MIAHVINELPRNVLGEGPLWDEDKLVYVDIAKGLIHRHDFAARAHQTISVEENVGFAVIDTEGKVVAGIGNGSIYRLQFGTRDREFLASPARDTSENLANDGKCDRSGRLWAGTKNKDESAADTGTLARFDGGKKLTEVLYPVHISNGLAWSPDNTRLYYNDSTDKIWQFDYDIATGAISNRRIWAKLQDDGAVPDGMTIDSRGALYVAMWGGSRVDVYGENEDSGLGVFNYSIEIPTALQISSVAFGGDGLNTLYITSASVGLTHMQRERYPDSGLVFSLAMPVPGMHEARFDSSNLKS
jgi:sugar lactone lactonase YvrE